MLREPQTFVDYLNKWSRIAKKLLQGQDGPSIFVKVINWKQWHSYKSINFLFVNATESLSINLDVVNLMNLFSGFFFQNWNC